MRLAIVSDIHANWQAWSAVLIDIRSQGIDRIVCLGDLVGYGPNPAEVLESAYAHVDHFVLGNHDAVLCGKMDPTCFNDDAQRMIDWTRGRLSDEAARFFDKVPLTLAAPGFRCSHGDFSEPGAFHYIIDPPDALPSWAQVPEPLLFVGHTHDPAIFLLGASGIPRVVPPQDFELEEGKRYLVNVGSVGLSRDGDTRASYCVFDTATSAVNWRRIPFDLDAYREAIRRAGLSEAKNHLLQHDPRQSAPPLRTLLSFSPAATPDQQVRDTVPVATLDLLRRDLRRWKTLAIAGAAVLLVAGLVTAVGVRRVTQRELTIPAGQIPILAPEAARAAPGVDLLTPPEAPVAAGQPIRGWQVRLGDRRRQAVAVTGDPSGPAIFALQSTAGREELRLTSTPVTVRPNQRLQIQGLVRPGTDFDGAVALYLNVTRRVDGREISDPLFLVKKPEWAQPDGWLRAQATSKPMPADAVSVTLELRGKFSGALEARDLTLNRRPD